MRLVMPLILSGGVLHGGGHRWRSLAGYCADGDPLDSVGSSWAHSIDGHCARQSPPQPDTQIVGRC